MRCFSPQNDFAWKGKKGMKIRIYIYFFSIKILSSAFSFYLERKVRGWFEDFALEGDRYFSIFKILHLLHFFRSSGRKRTKRGCTKKMEDISEDRRGMKIWNTRRYPCLRIRGFATLFAAIVIHMCYLTEIGDKLERARPKYDYNYRWKIHFH